MEDEQKDSGKKRQKIVLGVALVILLILLAAPVVADNYLTETYVRDFSAAAVVSPANDSMEVGVDTGANLDFGKVEKGLVVRKFVNLSAVDPTRVTTAVTGNISEILTTDESRFFTGSSVVEMKLNASTPGYYKGTVHIETQVASGSLGARWLRLKQQLY